MDRTPRAYSTDPYVVAQLHAQILLAEDDIDARSLIAVQLREDGHHVIETQTGQQLIRAAHRFRNASKPFDLLITDVRMPSSNGMEALGQLRRDGMDLPAIVMTAFGDAALYAMAGALQASLVLDKPFDLRVLRAAVARLLERSDPSRPSVA